MKKYRISKISLMTIGIMVFTLMGSYSFFAGKAKSLSWYMFFYGKIIVFFSFGLYCYFQLKKEERKFARWIMALLCFPALAAFLYSCIIWVIQGTTLAYVTRAISDTLFKCVALASGVILAFRLKDNAIKCTLVSGCVVYIISLLIGFVTQGTNMFSMLNVIGRKTSIAENYVELHELAYIIGLYIVFHLFIYKRKRIRISKGMMIAVLFFFIIAWKRIGILAVILLGVYGYFFYRKKPKKKEFYLLVTGIITIVVCHLYVSLSASDKLASLLNDKGINMMGRDIIYSYFRQFCTYSIEFIGRGVGFAGRQFDNVTSENLFNMSAIRAMHNDFFKIYIELGFIGFTVWGAYWIIRIPLKIKNKIDVNASFSCMLLIIYTFVLYTTDNTDAYFNYQMQLALLVSLTCCTRCYIGRNPLLAVGKDDRRTFLTQDSEDKGVQE